MNRWSHRRLAFTAIIAIIPAVIALLIALAASGYRDRQRRLSDPCRYEQTYVLLAKYSDLQRLWDRHEYELDLLEARHKAQRAHVDLLIKQDRISTDTLVAIEERLGKELESVTERQHREFESLCRRLVGS